MDQVTITLSGSPDRIRAVLDYWERTETSGSSPVSDSGASDVDAFVSALTADGRRVVRLVAGRSARGERLYQSDLLEASAAASERELFGLLGGVGIHWRRTRSEPNPFRRQWDEERRANFFQIDTDLAADILAALGIVTFVFTDLVGATAKQNELGDVAWSRLLSAYDDVVQGALSQYGGREVKWMGDAYMLVFKSPLDAVRCATAIQRALGGDLDGQQLRQRAGAHVGEAVRRGNDYVGAAVNFAASIASLAEPDELLVSEAVVEALGESSEFRSEARDPTEIRGFDGEYLLYRIEAEL